MTARAANSIDFDALADWIDDRVDTTIPFHALRTRRCQAWWAGPATNPHALVLLADYVPAEPWVFGADTEAALQLLQNVPDWRCVSVAFNLADAMSDALVRLSGRNVARYGDLYYEQREPRPVITHPLVREMTLGDAALLSAADADVRPGSAAFIDRLLREGHCTAAIIDGRVVARTHAYCITSKYADIGAATSAAHRGRGLSTACASLLCARLHEVGRVPIWSTGESNLPSQRVAEKLGFSLVSHRDYLSAS